LVSACDDDDDDDDDDDEDDEDGGGGGVGVVMPRTLGIVINYSLNHALICWRPSEHREARRDTRGIIATYSSPASAKLGYFVISI